jgi:Flp pilus assembly protein TadG
MRYFCLAMEPVLSSHARRRSRRGSRTRGQSLVEFAVVLPVFLLILSGILDFGFLLYSRMSVISATREGARVAVDAPKTSIVPATQATLQGRIPGLVRTRVTDAASGGLDTGALVTDVVCVDKATGTCAFNGSAEAGDSVKVTVHYPYHSIFPLLFGQTIEMSSTVQMVLE